MLTAACNCRLPGYISNFRYKKNSASLREKLDVAIALNFRRTMKLLVPNRYLLQEQPFVSRFCSRSRVVFEVYLNERTPEKITTNNFPSNNLQWNRNNRI